MLGKSPMRVVAMLVLIPKSYCKMCLFKTRPAAMLVAVQSVSTVLGTVFTEADSDGRLCCSLRLP